MEIFQCYPSLSKDRMYCPSTDEVIFAPHYEEIEEDANAFVAYWHGEIIDEPMIKNQKLAQAWEEVHKDWSAQEDPEMDSWELVDKFLSEYENPDWIVYECTFYGMACGPVQSTVYYVVKADTIIEEDPDREEEEDSENHDTGNLI